MKLRGAIRAAGGILAVAMAAAGAVSCSEVSTPGPPPEPVPDPLPADPRRRASRPALDDETRAQLDLFYALQERILELEVEIAEFNHAYVATGFCDFLDLDPWSLPAAQVYFLKHFCDNGDFTLPKEAEILLLERTIARVQAGGAAASGEEPISRRLDETIARFEQRIADLERIARLYRETSEDVISYPDSVPPETLERERRYVAARQADISDRLDFLDERIFSLRDELAQWQER